MHSLSLSLSYYRVDKQYKMETVAILNIGHFLPLKSMASCIRISMPRMISNHAGMQEMNFDTDAACY